MSSSTSRSDVSSLEVAVRVHNLNLTYGGCFQGSKVEVMKNLSMEVPRGAIYGLLGPSGCGKTSLMRCILGTLRANSGEITVFGTVPGTAKSKVPGPGVGYMPQDITLYGDLTIKETLFYFASLIGMKQKDISKRADFLVSFLDLSDQNRLIGNLSGGQKRRTSLAVALIHKPPLLILDEPTVGVDPLLRKSIWDHLIQLSRKDRLTVLITTHYIEEAKGANLVGFMRDCKLLDQDTPANLLARHELPTLEQVFLHLCYQEEARKVVNNAQKDVPEKVVTSSKEIGPVPVAVPEPPKPKIKTFDPDTIKRNPPFYQCATMILKNLRSLIRKPGYLLFQFLFPMIEAIIFCAAFGRDLAAIPLAVYDGDQSQYSISILEQLNKEILKPTIYSTEWDAIESVRNGTQSTAMVIHPHFSDCLIARIGSLNATPAVIRNSTIELIPDMTNSQMVTFVSREVMYAFTNVTKRMYPQFSGAPINMSLPIYGRVDPPYTYFMAPGAILSIAFFASISLTCMNLLLERIHGLMERTNVVGVSVAAILTAHAITYVAVLLVQVILLLVVILAIYRIPYSGSLFWIGALAFLQSICGLTVGLFISAVSDTEMTATMLSIGLFYPALQLSGTAWPLNAMPSWLHKFAYCLPQTIPSESLRYLMIRGWGIGHWAVASGFVITIGWSAFFLIVSIFVIKFRQY